MSHKQFILDFYKNDLILNKSEVSEFLHDDLMIEWNSSKGFVQMNKQDVLNLSDELSKAYVRSKMRITHLIEEKDTESKTQEKKCF